MRRTEKRAGSRDSQVHRGRLCLLAVASLGLILSMLDPRAAGRSPWHEHIVIGAHGLKEWTHALMTHRHEAAGPPEGSASDGLLPPPHPMTPKACGVRVIAIDYPDGSSATAFGVASTALTYPGGSSPLPVPGENGRMPVAVPHRPSSVAAAVPDPPPRPFS